MPLFFVDIDNGERIARDPEGTRSEDLGPVRREMVRALAQLAKDVSPETGSYDLVGRIRDASGRTLCRATLSLRSSPAV